MTFESEGLLIVAFYKWLPPASYVVFLTTLVRYFFYAPGLKGPPGASSVWIVCLSVRPSVRPSVCPSVRNSVPLINEVQYLKFGWSYSNQTWTVSHLRIAHTSLTSHAPGGGAGSKCRT